MKTSLVSRIVNLVVAIENCKKSNNIVWFYKHSESLKILIDNYMPHGSGFDDGTKIDMEKSNAEKLVFHMSYHHMDSESGMYDGWTEHVITVKASLAFNLTVTVSGRNRDDIKSLISEMVYDILTTED